MAALAFALSALAAGCGADDDAGAPPPSASGTELEMTIWAEGEGTGEARRYTLSCDPPTGDHPDPAAACAALEELGARAFDPVPGNAVCTQQYGGPMEATVAGRVGGDPVDAKLRYSDGCEIARWNAVEDVVPRPEWQPS